MLLLISVASKSALAHHAATILPPFWRIGAEIDERVTRDRRRRAELLLELAQRDLERLLAGLDLALRNRPDASSFLA